MKKQFLRVLSIVLSLALFLGIVPTAALTVLAEAVGDVLTRVESVTVGDIEVTPDNIGYRLEFTGTGEDPLGGVLTWDVVHSWTQEDLDSFAWEIHGIVYDEDYNEVEVTEGHFEYLWCYSIGMDGGGGIDGVTPVGMTQGQWQNKVQAHWENYPDDYDGLGLLETMDGWTSDTDAPVLSTYHELTGLPGDFYVPFTLMAYIRYVSESGEVVIKTWSDFIMGLYIEGGYEIIPISVEATPINWKYGGAITTGTVKASIGQTYTPAVYQPSFRDANGYVYGPGSRQCHYYQGGCRCYEFAWVLLRDGVTAETYSGDPGQFVPVGMDEETWDGLLAEYGDDHNALYDHLFYGLGYAKGNAIPLYTTEGLTTGEISWDTSSFTLEDYGEYTIAPIVGMEYEECIFDEEGLIVDALYKHVFGTGAPVTVVPVEPGQDGGEENLPVFREASPLPEEYIAGRNPLQTGIQLICNASYGSVPLSYQWYRSETPDYNGVAIVDIYGDYAQEATYYAVPPDAQNLDKTYYYYCEYSFTNINGVKETYYTTITKCKRLGALGIDVTVTPGEIYMGDVPGNTDNFKSYYTRFNSSNLPLTSGDYDGNKRGYSAVYAYQSKGSDSVLSAWIEPSTGTGRFKFSDYITYQWYKSDTMDYTTGEAVSDVVTIDGLEQFTNSRTSVNGLRSYPDFNEFNQYANIHIDCPTDEVGEFYMTVVVKNYYTDERQVQHVYETYSTCRVTTFEKNEDLYHVTKDGMLDAYNGHESVMTIPAEVNGIKVTSLDTLACQVKAMNADKDVHHVAGARKIIFPEGLTEVSEYAFFRLYTLEEIVFSSTITTIGEMAFSDTGRIKNLVIPDHITTIQKAAFRRSRVEKITFDENVWPDFGNAFYDSYYLNTVILPANATGAIDGAFYGCTQLIRVENYENINYVRDDADFYITFTDDFSGCPASEYIKVGAGGCDGNFTYVPNKDGASWRITEIWGDYLEHVTIPATYKGLPVTVLGRGTGTDGVSNMLNAHLVKWPEYLKSVTIPDTVTVINDYAFENCEYLESFNFHSGISVVGAKAFKNCHRLTSDVVLAAGAEVCEEAFYYCYLITRVEAPNVQLASASFNGCYSLEYITSNSRLLPPASGDDPDASYGYWYYYSNFIGTKLYTDYSDLSVYFTSRVSEPRPNPYAGKFKRSGNYLYQVKNNKAIHDTYLGVNDTYITFPSRLDGYVADTVSSGVFSAMLSDGYEVVFEEGITKLGSGGTENKTTKVTLPESLVELGSFFGGSNKGVQLTEVHIPSGITKLDNSAFYGCTQLQKVTFDRGNQLTAIGTSAFNGCTSLNSVEFDKLIELKTIENGAFSKTAFSVLDLRGCTALTLIDSGAFSYIPSLDEVYLPDNLEEIGSSAFAKNQWDGDSDVYVDTLDPLSVLVLPENLKIVRSTAFHGQFMDNAENDPFMLDLPDSLEVIETDAFGGYSLTGMNGEVFVNNIQLANEKLPASLKKFGSGTTNYAPFSWSEIDTLVFQPNIEELLNTYAMDSLSKIVFEANETGSSNLRVLKALLQSEENCEIVGWDNLNNLQTIDRVSFGDWKYDKAEYTFPATVRTVGSFGWTFSTTFDTIIIPDGVQSIGGMPCVSTPENPRKIIAYGTSASVPKLKDKWLQYDHSLIEENGYELAPLYCYTGSVYHEWAVEHNYPYILMDDGANTITLKFYDSVLNKRQAYNDYFRSVKWTDKDGNVLSKQDLLTNVTPGEEYTYTVKFYDNKSWDYTLPYTTGTVTAIEGGASVNLTIAKMDKITLTGSFVNFAEPGFTATVQQKTSYVVNPWRTVATFTAADLDENGNFSVQVEELDTRIVLEASSNSKCTKTTKTLLYRSGRTENGVVDMGAIEMKYKGAERYIPSNTDLALAGDLYLQTSFGSMYKVYVASGYINIQKAIEAGVRPGDTVTLVSATSGGQYFIDPYSFVVPYDGLATPISPVLRQMGGIHFDPTNNHGYLYIYDSAGDYVTDLYGNFGERTSLVAGTYTIVGVGTSKLQVETLAQLESLNINPENYYRQTVTVVNDYITVDQEVPKWKTFVADAKMSYNIDMLDRATGTMPIQVHYSLAEEKSVTLRFVYESTDAPFIEMNGQYVYHSQDGVVEAVEVTTDETATYLNVTVNSGGTLTFYMDGTRGGCVVMQSLNPQEFIASLRLPTIDFETTVPEEYTNEKTGYIRVTAKGPGSQYYASLIVDGEQGPRYKFSTNGTALPYTLETAKDGSTAHDIQAVVYYGNDPAPVWYSDVYTVTHTNQPMMTAKRLDITAYNYNCSDKDEMLTESVNMGFKATGYYDIVTGFYVQPSIYIASQLGLDPSGFVKKDIIYKFSLSVKNRVVDAVVTLYLYDANDNVRSLNLTYNSETHTYDGVLTFTGGTFTEDEFPHAFDVSIEANQKMKEAPSETYLWKRQAKEAAKMEMLLENAGKDIELIDLDELQTTVDGMTDLTPEEREDIMQDYIQVNEGRQAFNDMSDTLATSLAEMQNGEAMTRLKNLISDEGFSIETISLADDPPTPEVLLAEGYTFVEFNGRPMYYFTSEVSTSVIYLDEDCPEDSVMTIMVNGGSTFDLNNDDVQAASTAKTLVSTGTEVAQDAGMVINDLIDRLDKIMPDPGAPTQPGLGDGGPSAKELNAAKDQLKATKAQMDAMMDALQAGDMNATKAAALALKGGADAGATALARLVPGFGTALSVAFIAADFVLAVADTVTKIEEMSEKMEQARDYIEKYKELKDCWKPDCNIQMTAAEKELEELEKNYMLMLGYTILQDFNRAGCMFLDAFATVLGVLSETGAGAAASLAISGLSTVISLITEKIYGDAWNDWRNEYDVGWGLITDYLPTECIDFANCDDDDDFEQRDPGPDEDPEDDRKKKIPPHFQHDPAGYVYEAVASNRIEGATAKVYYQDKEGNEVFWAEAPDFGEVNPQLTDAAGCYAWMTPTGNWRVRITKEGYYEGNSLNDPAADENGWLPVPPPQLNVNIGIVSKAAPTVERVDVASDRIRVVFSQYMDIAQLETNSDLIQVKMNGTTVSVKFAFADAEESPTKEGVYYGRTLIITRTDEAAFEGDNVTVSISALMKNYAGTLLGSRYESGKLSVGQIADALSHSYPNRLVVDLSETAEVALQVTDTQGKPMAGVEVAMIEQIGGLLVATNHTVISDENGRVMFNVTGENVGTERLIFTTADGLSTQIEVAVSEKEAAQPAKPTANLSDYSVVDCGTELVISTDVEGGIIYYTTNDTCPCTESEERKVYTGPIDLTESAFYRIAVWTEEGGYSERLNLHLTVEHDYAEDGVTCNRCGSSEGDDPIVEDILTFDGYSVSEDVNGLAFRFTIDVTGMNQKGTTAVYDNAKVMYNGQEYSLVGMGAIVSNKAGVELTRENIDGVQTIDIFAKYLWNLNEDSASYAVRVIDIPENGKDTTVYARAYFVIEVEGEQVVVYADDVAEQTYNGVLNS